MTEAQLKEIKQQTQKQNAVRFLNLGGQKEIMVCSSTGCESINSKGVIEALEQKTKAIGANIKISKVGCMGLCGLGPIVVVYPNENFYIKVKPEDVDDIIDACQKGTYVERLLYSDGETKYVTLKEIPFFNKQIFIARNAEALINPESIEEYIALDGYFAIHKCIFSLSPDEIIDIVQKSGIRGRGGAGFPTGKKWQFARASVSDEKYVVCNGDEGDPGAFMDRSIMERNPHAILEALMIAGRAIGASHGIIYVRAEYALAGKRLEKAICDARALGLLGNNIFGSDFSFDIEIKYGAGAFVCGEETALLRSCEGGRGEPTKKPPYPATSGFRGKPTVINNVETLACIPQIIVKGAEWFSSFGTAGSKGTKVFALSGKINHPGLVELEMGTTINDIVYGVGGGIPDGKKLKAVLMGGPSGGCIPAELCDTEIDFESLKSNGAMMGSGGMIVLDEDSCMVDIAKFFLSFTVDESCGKCTPCRIGNKRMLDILTKICDGEASMQDLDELEEVAHYVKDNSLCGLGQTSPNPVLSTLRFFKDEYVAHIKDKKCPAGVCQKLIKYEIDPNKCVGCGSCKRACPTMAVSGEIRKTHSIDQNLCIKCGSCKRACRFSAVRKV